MRKPRHFLRRATFAIQSVCLDMVSHLCGTVVGRWVKAGTRASWVIFGHAHVAWVWSSDQSEHSHLTFLMSLNGSKHPLRLLHGYSARPMPRKTCFQIPHAWQQDGQSRLIRHCKRRSPQAWQVCWAWHLFACLISQGNTGMLHENLVVGKRSFLSFRLRRSKRQ